MSYNWQYQNFGCQSKIVGPKSLLILFDMGFFEPSVMGGTIRAPHHNFVVIAPMITKFGTGVKLDIFYAMVTKKFVTSLLLRHYNVITCILADISLNFRCS